MIGLALAFCATAMLYASVGFGGGSTYNALLVVGGADFRVVPVVALVCNLVVVAGGTLAAQRAGTLRLELALPLTLASVPLAWLGGATPIDERLFVLILGATLVAAGVLLLVSTRNERKALLPPGAPGADTPIARGSVRWKWLLGVPVGGALGFLAGMVGIGGGIFLAPLLHLARVAPPKVIAATASFFILVNSLAGLAGQAFKLHGDLPFAELQPYVWLPGAVLVGGQLGTRAGLHLLSERGVRRLTAGLVFYVGVRLLIVS